MVKLAVHSRVTRQSIAAGGGALPAAAGGFELRTFWELPRLFASGASLPFPTASFLITPAVPAAMSEPEFVPSDEEESESSSSGEEYVASEEEAPQRKRPLPRPSNRGGGGGGAAAAAAPKRQRAAQQPKLPDLLQSASKEQLVALVLSLNQQAGGQLEGRIGDLLPPPDLTVGAGPEVLGLSWARRCAC